MAVRQSGKTFLDYQIDLSKGINQAIHARRLQDGWSPFMLNISLTRNIPGISKRLGNQILGSSSAGEIHGLFEHNNNAGTYTKLRVDDAGNLEKLTTGTWSDTESSAFTSGEMVDGVPYTVSGDPRVYMVNGTDIMKWTDESGIVTDVSTLTGSGRRIVVAKNRLYQGCFTTAGKENRFEYSETYSDQFYKDGGETYVTSTNFELVDSQITSMAVLDDNPIIFTKNKTYYWDQLSTSLTQIANKGTASLYGCGVIPESNMLIFAGLDNIYAYRFGQRFATPIANALLGRDGLGIYELITDKSAIKVGCIGYKAYIAIGDITIPDFDENGDFTISDACIEYDSRLDAFTLHNNFRVNQFRLMDNGGLNTLYYGADDYNAVFGIETGTDYNDHDNTGSDVGINAIFRTRSYEANSPLIAKVFTAAKIRLAPTSTAKYIDVYLSKNDGVFEKYMDATTITNSQRLSMAGDTDYKWLDKWISLPASKTDFCIALEFRNSDTDTNMMIDEILIEGEYTDNRYKFITNDRTL